MNEDQIKLARHALGLDVPRVTTRNRYAAAPGTPSHQAWMAMVEAGDAILTLNEEPYNHFCLTSRGAEKALRDGEKLDLEEFDDDE